MIRSIVFDMGNVLIHWRPEFFLEREGIPEEDRLPLLRSEEHTSELQSQR